MIITASPDDTESTGSFLSFVHFVRLNYLDPFCSQEDCFSSPSSEDQEIPALDETKSWPWQVCTEYGYDSFASIAVPVIQPTDHGA